jgi:3-hydroxybutyryl-CoA dehydrogenase
MQLVVLGSDGQWAELAVETPELQWIRAAEDFSFSQYPEADAFFMLQQQETVDLRQTGKPIFLNSAALTLKELNAPVNVLRINGWNSFLKRPLWEVAGTITETAATILKQLNKTPVAVKDETGLIADRAVAMIINEAYFALGDEVSDKAAIDTAMKLGTNYPYGPFEWAEIIGLKNIYALLQKLSAGDARYTPAPSLLKEVFSTAP